MEQYQLLDEACNKAFLAGVYRVRSYVPYAGRLVEVERRCGCVGLSRDAELQLVWSSQQYIITR
jgi:hypothetical protein